MASEIKESESPPSQSQRADPPQSQSAAKLNKVYVFFWHPYSSVMYSLYEIEVPKPLPPPPDKATQADEIENPKKLLPVLQLKTGQYPDGMSCVSLGSKLYFVGGEFNMDNPYIDEDVKINFKASKRDVFPRQLLILDLSEVGASGDELHKLLIDGEQMRSGKARPHAFVAEEKIYVIGSTIESSISHRSKLTRIENLESFKFFEVYDPKVGKWDDLPDPPIGNVKTRWVGHAIVRRKALLVAWQGGKERLYCFDLGESRWTDASIPFYPENFSGRTEFVEDTLYGCYHNTIAAIAPKKIIEKEEKKEKKRRREKIEGKKVKAEEGEKMEEKKVEAEEGEKMEAEKVKAKETVEAEEEEEDAKDFGQGWLLEKLDLHVLSEEMGMDAIFNVPPQLQSSSSLLHLGNRYFCYVKSGMPPNSDDDSDDDIKDDKKRFISIVIFRALGKKYEEDGTGLLQAQFLYSAHYEINSPFPNEGFINGCFFPGLKMATPTTRSESWITDSHLEDGEDSTTKAQNSLLVVPTLITAVVFLAVVNFVGIWQDDDHGHRPGSAIYASRKQANYVFLVCNTLTIFTSVLVIMSLTYRFTHFQFKDREDSTTEAGNVLFMAIALIATLIFRSVVHSSGGVWQDDDNGHRPGSAIYASRKQAYHAFFVFSALTIWTSVLVIMSLTYRLSFHLEMKMATPPTTRSKSWFTHFQFKDGKDSTTKTRNVLGIVTTLIAAVTFRVMVSPSRGVWQDDELTYYAFLVLNTVTAFTSALVSMSLTYRFPFHLEMKMATPPTTRSKSWFTHSQFKDGKDSTTKTRNVLEIVALCIATVTFQAVVDPPGGVWQDDVHGLRSGSAIFLLRNGSAIYASRKQSYYAFLVFNIVALSTSVLVILSLADRFPFHLEILIDTASMLVTHGCAIFAVTPHEFCAFRYVLTAAALPFVLRVLFERSTFVIARFTNVYKTYNSVSL